MRPLLSSSLMTFALLLFTAPALGYDATITIQGQTTFLHLDESELPVISEIHCWPDENAGQDGGPSFKNSLHFGYSIGPRATLNISVVVSLSVRPTVVVSSGIPLVAGWISYRSANDFTISFYNFSNSPVNATAIVDYWWEQR